ncbi:hypothetical protein O181_031644 [Austropuccinia psidii MF-1]|uniref:Uncharacterized protein n=1 Tax=Austropuccinia psidii MF-1 TaxID=1389203 RepID=A0A9Q3CW37_9BASI|nr:hypothetical protein [Austropuccinia psidii MF-1]
MTVIAWTNSLALGQMLKENCCHQVSGWTDYNSSEHLSPWIGSPSGSRAIQSPQPPARLQENLRSLVRWLSGKPSDQYQNSRLAQNTIDLKRKQAYSASDTHIPSATSVFERQVRLQITWIA